MPSIWITSNPRSERSVPIHSFSRAADSATKRREAADFDRPEPLGAGTSPSGKRIERSNLRVETVDQHLVHGPFTEPVFCHRPFPTGKGLLLAVEATKPRTRDLHLAAVETDLAFRLAPAMRRPILA